MEEKGLERERETCRIRLAGLTFPMLQVEAPFWGCKIFFSNWTEGEPNTTLIEIVVINLCSPRCFYTTFARQPATSQSASRCTCGNMTDSLARPEIWSALISRSRETEPKKTNQTWNMQSAELAKSKKPMPPSYIQISPTNKRWLHWRKPKLISPSGNGPIWLRNRRVSGCIREHIPCKYDQGLRARSKISTPKIF